MHRLRTRLIAAFLGVAIMAMVPLAVISYYKQQVRNQKVRLQMLENSLKEIEEYINYQSNLPANVLLPLAQYIQYRFEDRPNLLELLELSESLDDTAVRGQISWWEKALLTQILDGKVPGGNLLLQLNPQILKQDYDSLKKNPQYPIQIIPKIPYLKMKEWLDEGLLYDEDDKIYCYKLQPIFKGKRASEMEEVGGLFYKMLLIEKYPNDPTRQPDFYLRNKRFEPQPVVLNPQPRIFERYLSNDDIARLFGFSPYKNPQEVDVDWIRIDSSDVEWPQQFRLAQPSQKEENSPNFLSQSDDIETIPMQMKLIPIINHRHELAAIMVLGVPIVSILGTIGVSLLIGYGWALLIIILAAVLFARSIARPIWELSTAARTLSGGDLAVRVHEKGAIELRILASSFNHLAEQIQNQLLQLQHQTHELESSNRELSQTQRFLNNILANIRTGVMSIDPEGQISHINQIGEDILHITHWHGKSVTELVDCSPFTNLITYSLQKTISIHENEIPYECQEGLMIPLQVSTVPVLESGELQGLVVTFHDLSAIRQLEEKIRRQDRLAALGRMAAGVAHEIRNPLGIIRGSAELLHKRFGGQAGEEGLTDFILEEVKRLSRVVNDFLQFARPPEPIRNEVPIGVLFEDLVDYFEKQQIGDAYRLKTEILNDPPAIAADLNLCRQVFLNLFMNAQQAMPNGGIIILRARPISIREVVIEVEDCGEGIPPDHLDKIFDPFFTSKENGTGLGLSLVHQIMSSHGGRVEVDSIHGRGSIFRVIFLSYDSMSCDSSVNEWQSLVFTAKNR